LYVASSDPASKIHAIIAEDRMFQPKQISKMYEMSTELSTFLQFQQFARMWLIYKL